METRALFREYLRRRRERLAQSRRDYVETRRAIFRALGRLELDDQDRRQVALPFYFETSEARHG